MGVGLAALGSLAARPKPGASAGQDLDSLLGRREDWWRHLRQPGGHTVCRLRPV